MSKKERILFEAKERTSQDGPSWIESDWAYLDRSGRAEAQRVRDFLNYWVSEYPSDHRNDLVSRISSGDNTNFKSATFELVLFAVLKTLGCKVDVHPELPNKNPTHPDFFVVTPEGDSLYIEAVLASEFSKDDISARKRIKQILNSIEKIDSPNFFIGVKVEGQTDDAFETRSLRNELKKWLNSLDPDSPVFAGPDEFIPKFLWPLKSYKLQLMSDLRGKETSKQRILYVSLEHEVIQYCVLKNCNAVIIAIKGQVEAKDLPAGISMPTTSNNLQQFESIKDDILSVTDKRGHTPETMTFTFWPIPKKHDRQGQSQRVIGALLDEVRFLNIWEAIRDAVKNKGQSYGILEHPLLVAINVDALFLHSTDEMEGLFGQEEWFFVPSGIPDMKRKSNGAWTDKQYTRVSGAWIFHGLNPFNIPERKNTVYFNPWAQKPLPGLFTTIPYVKADGNTMNRYDGCSLGEILSLSSEWPEQ